ncbi:hypothetical protein U8335_25840 [Roseiconus lacunae]|uniref:Uncharacterized protein n=1 Tax=Roseiconus lacunae TaxID=2605694 RepID=A0ABT7PEW1_9BACT|nr:hypothetical protein [Roseiconus lacunae]MDM4014771.1 hypothetical protein [Roseiconus lacunae]WRQ50360.1 hypothetical protein U8335_25840 [Stieleria sp. HD01]
MEINRLLDRQFGVIVVLHFQYPARVYFNRRQKGQQSFVKSSTPLVVQFSIEAIVKTQSVESLWL